MTKKVLASPSKSYTHRALISAAVTRAKVKVFNPLYCDDTSATIVALKKFGVNITEYDNYLYIDASGGIKAPIQAVDCVESGSTLRMLVPLALLFEDDIEFIGRASLSKRPLTSYIELFDSIDVSYSYDNALPLTVKSKKIVSDIEVKSDVSSQFISGLIYYLVYLNVESTITLIGEIVSIDYIKMTLDTLKSFGVHTEFEADVIKIYSHKNSTIDEYTVEGDYSQAAFYIAYGIICQDIIISGLYRDSLQADRVIVDIVKNMGAVVEQYDDKLLIKKSKTAASNINVSNCPDLAPPLALIAALSEGKTTITGTKRLRIKESDRVESVVSALKSIGADISIKDDDIVINGVEEFTGGVVDSENDHRIVMMSTIASTRSKNRVSIINKEAVSKSYPRFFDDFAQLGGNYE